MLGYGFLLCLVFLNCRLVDEEEEGFLSNFLKGVVIVYFCLIYEENFFCFFNFLECCKFNVLVNVEEGNYNEYCEVCGMLNLCNCCLNFVYNGEEEVFGFG